MEPQLSETNYSTQDNHIQQLIENIENVIKGKPKQIKLVITCLLAKGHILMEDNPGSGKTVLAKTLAGSLSGPGQENTVFKRIQFTPDLLPMDLLGIHVFDDIKKEFIFKKGPLFCNVLLADEINRASPKVQSALLECMAEHQITMGDITYPLENMFFTIATQNPIEMEGTYPLPAAQLDRFFMKIHFGYVDAKYEMEILQQYQQINQQLLHVKQVLTVNEIISLQEKAEAVFIHQEIIQAVLNIITATRHMEGIALGASTRSGIIFMKCLKAYAMVHGRDFVLEDDILDITPAVLNHRLIYSSKEAKSSALNNIIQQEMKRLSSLNLSKYPNQ